jgi:O-antigen/teichoic acid export membrane protein
MSRTQRLLQGAFSAILGKGAVFLVNAASVPIMVRYLGTDSFGVWVTITTTLSMLLVLDLGIANSLVNFISEAYAKEDHAHASTYATTALGIMGAVALIVGGTAWWIWPLLDWARIFHLSSPSSALVAGHACAAALGVFLLGLPAGLSMKILGGYQELRSANIFTAAGSISSLILIVLLVRLHAGLVALVAGSSAALVGANLVCMVWLWVRHKPWLAPRLGHLNRAAARRMMNSGGQFFVLQIAALVVFNSDNLVIAHYLGPAQVATYSIAWRLTGYAAIAQSLLLPALWPAYSEAFARGDLAWVRRTFWRTLWTTMSTAFAATLVFAIAGRWIIRLWAGNSAVASENLLLLMCAWVLINAFMNNTVIVLIAKGQIRLQVWLSLAASGLNLALSIWLVQQIGSAGVIVGTIVSYLVLLIVPQSWNCYRVLKGVA